MKKLCLTDAQKEALIEFLDIEYCESLHTLNWELASPVVDEAYAEEHRRTIRLCQKWITEIQSEGPLSAWKINQMCRCINRYPGC